MGAVRHHITRFGILKDTSGRSEEDELKREETDEGKGQAQLSPLLPPEHLQIISRGVTVSPGGSVSASEKLTPPESLHFRPQHMDLDLGQLILKRQPSRFCPAITRASNVLTQRAMVLLANVPYPVLLFLSTPKF